MLSSRRFAVAPPRHEGVTGALLVVALGVGGMVKLGRFHLGIAALTVFLMIFLGTIYYRRAAHEAFVSGRTRAPQRRSSHSAVAARAGSDSAPISFRSRVSAWLKEVVRHRALFLFGLGIWGSYELALRLGMHGKPAVIFAWLSFPTFMVVIWTLANRYPQFERRIRPALQWLSGKE